VTAEHTKISEQLQHCAWTSKAECFSTCSCATGTQQQSLWKPFCLNSRVRSMSWTTGVWFLWGSRYFSL
jgi:hypothetical protein